MKIYIAGKITGDKHYKRKFKRAEKLLRSLGCSVMNPAWIVPSREFSYEDYMKVSGAMQEVCNGVYFLLDWTKSLGSQREMERTTSLDQKVFFEGSGMSLEYLKRLLEKEKASSDKVG